MCAEGVTNATAQLLCVELGYDMGVVARGGDGVGGERQDTVLGNVSCEGALSWSSCIWDAGNLTEECKTPLFLGCSDAHSCDPGFHWNGTVCSHCKHNTYSPGGGARCKRCPHLSHSPPGASHCTSCPLGDQWSNHSCVRCPSGYYGDGAKCHLCQDGFTSGEDGLCHNKDTTKESWSKKLLVRGLVGAAGGAGLWLLIMGIWWCYARRDQGIQLVERIRYIRMTDDTKGKPEEIEMPGQGNGAFLGSVTSDD